MRPARPEILATFRERKVRCTPQRYTILDYLNRNARHPTAEEIYQAINRSDPRASLATVYKSLHALAAAGLIREVTVEGNAVRFESNMDKHHHFVCESCGAIEDISDCNIVALEKDIEKRKHIKVTSHSLEFFGICANCQK